MKKNKSIRIIKRIFCTTFAMFLIISNFSLVFANFIYDSSMQLTEDFSFSEHRSIKMAKISEIEEFNLYGAELNDIENIVLDRKTKKSFTALNTSNLYNRMLHTVGEIKWDSIGNSYSYDQKININGVEYNTTLIKEEIEFTDLVLKAKHLASGRFSYIGEYQLRSTAKKSETAKMIVTVEGDVYDYYYVYTDFKENKTLNFGLNLIADNNVAKIDINEKIQELPFANNANEFSTDDLGKITIRFIAPIDIAEFISEQSSATPKKVIVAVVASIIIATTGSVALSSLSANKGDSLDLGEETNNFEDFDEKNLNDKISHTMIINNNKTLPILCNSKGAVVNIPIHIKDGENLTWDYFVIPCAPGGLESFTTTVINPFGDNSADLLLSFTGNKLEENSMQITCKIYATAKSYDKEYKAHGIAEFTLYNLGLHAKIKNMDKNITKDNLVVTYVKDSKFKGIAEIIKIKNKEFAIEFAEKTESQTIALITANKSEYGSIVITKDITKN